jgi:hypothetical protein
LPLFHLSASLAVYLSNVLDVGFTADVAINQHETGSMPPSSFKNFASSDDESHDNDEMMTIVVCCDVQGQSAIPWWSIVMILPSARQEHMQRPAAPGHMDLIVVSPQVDSSPRGLFG